MPVTNANLAFIGYGPEAEDIDKDQSPWRVFVPDNFLFSFIHDVDSVQSGLALLGGNIASIFRMIFSAIEIELAIVASIAGWRRSIILRELAGCENRRSNQQDSFSSFAHRGIIQLRFLFA